MAPIHKRIIIKVFLPNSLLIALIIIAVSSAGGADMRTMDRRTEGHHVLVNHAAEEGIASCIPGDVSFPFIMCTPSTQPKLDV